MSVLAKNATATESIFLGGSGVTTADGFEWATAEGPLETALQAGEELYGIVALTAQTVHVLRQGR